MPLTHCPDPPNLCDTGPGTAAEQAARPQMFADYVNGGWKPATPPVPPMTLLPIGACAADFTNSQGWLLHAPERVNFTSGALNDTNVLFTQFNLETPGLHTITATAVDDAAVTTFDVLVRDQTVAPTLASIAPTSYPIATTGAVEVVLTGTGFTAAARPRVITYQANTSYLTYEPTFELISATQMRIWFDTAANPQDTDVQVYVWFPDNSTTYPRGLSPL